MQSFEDWLATCTVPAAKTYQDKLLDLQISHHTFRRPPEEVVQDLIAAGIPRLPAGDIVSAAKTFFDTQKDRAALPLAVFWDVENVRIPSELSGEVVARNIKQKMKPFGMLSVFNAYFEVSSTHMPPEKRSALQLSGCHIIDTPHINRKEVADKMIIVDALLFAYQNKDHGGTMCFITGDTDYAYMLSKISELKQFRTVLVTQSKSRDVLHMSANTVFNWGLDILGGTDMIPAAASPLHGVGAMRPHFPEDREDKYLGVGGSSAPVRSPSATRHAKKNPWKTSPSQGPVDRLPAGFPVESLPPAVKEGVPSGKEGEQPPSATSGTVAPETPKEQPPPTPQVGGATPKRFPRTESIVDMLPTAEDEMEDAMSLVRQVMFELQTGMNYRPLKSLVGIKLKEKNPIRFGDKAARQAVLDKACDPVTGFLKQEGELGNVTLAFRADAFRPPHG